MFVRWKHSRLKRDRHGSEAGEEILRAVVVEGRRVDGKPRQRVVRYLGTIHESDVSRPRLLSLDRFWRQVDAGLDELGVHDVDRLAMASTISARVPRPDPTDVERTRQGFEARKGGVQSMLQRMASGRPG